jgi:hypothetical protein
MTGHPQCDQGKAARRLAAILASFEPKKDCFASPYSVLNLALAQMLPKR